MSNQEVMCSVLDAGMRGVEIRVSGVKRHELPETRGAGGWTFVGQTDVLHTRLKGTDAKKLKDFLIEKNTFLLNQEPTYLFLVFNNKDIVDAF